MQTLAITGFLMLVFFLVPCDMGLLLLLCVPNMAQLESSYPVNSQ